MSERVEDAHQAASMHYLQGLTMEAIAARMDVSRSTVSRLLSYARESGIVKISVAPLSENLGSAAAQLKDRFGVNVRIVPVRRADPDLVRLRQVARVAASQVSDSMTRDATLGIAWGNTTSAITPFLPQRNLPGTTVVQLNGAANASDTGLPYADAIISQAAEAFGARMVHFPVPAFFDYAETKKAMWKERSIRRVLETIKSCSVALFGVGSLSGALLSHVYASGFLEETEIQGAIKDGVVGDICTVLIRRDGSTDMELNARATGPRPEQLRQIPTRICVAAGNSKAVPLLGALRAGVATDLVIDSALAEELLLLLRRRQSAA